jgi:hypothetical protein
MSLPLPIKVEELVLQKAHGIKPRCFIADLSFITVWDLIAYIIACNKNPKYHSSSEFASPKWNYCSLKNDHSKDEILSRVCKQRLRNYVTYEPAFPNRKHTNQETRWDRNETTFSSVYLQPSTNMTRCGLIAYLAFSLPLIPQELYNVM